jgi:hypothetical protein
MNTLPALTRRAAPAAEILGDGQYLSGDSFCFFHSSRTDPANEELPSRGSNERNPGVVTVTQHAHVNYSCRDRLFF